jgi:hypothetical protein
MVAPEKLVTVGGRSVPIGVTESPNFGRRAYAILPSEAIFPTLPQTEYSMAEPQLSVRSAKARDLAHRLARRERRSIADVVERALEAYEVREAGREPAQAFYTRLSSEYGSDVDLESVIRESRRVNRGPEL